MRSFSTKEKKLIKIIISMTSAQNVSLKKLLEKMFCIEEKGRAVIIQTSECYSVFYLKNNLFDNEEAKKEQCSAFLEVISLLKYLSQNFYIYFLPIRYEKDENVYCIQDGFDHPEIVKDSIILNKQGEYTNHPQNIMDKGGNIIYKGVFLDKDTSSFLANHCNEVLLMAEQLKNLLVEEMPKIEEKTKKQKKWKWSSLLNVFMILKFGIMMYLIWNELQHQNVNINTITASNTEMISNIDSVKIALGTLDSLFIEKLPKKESTPKPLPEIGFFYGIDISHYNKDVVDKIDLSDSISFVICKATEGIHYRDSYFDYNWKRLKEKSIIRGAYHFYRVNVNPTKQANHYINVVKKWNPDDIMPIVDIEQNSISTSTKKKINKEKLQKDLLLFLEHIEKNTKRKPMIYVSKSFADKYLLNKKFAKYPLWIADYKSKKAPRLPKTWRNVGYKIWQKSNNYHIKSTREDLDVFYGKLEDIYN